MIRFAAVVLVLLTLGAAGQAAAQPTNDEIRLTFGSSWGKTSGDTGGTFLESFSRLSMRFELGYRHFWDSGHGVLVDLTYRNEVAECFLFGCVDSIDFLVGHAGYGYRQVFPMKKDETRAITVTPHVSLSTGLAIASSETVANSGVLGARVGIDSDFHFKRYFFGFGFAYEFLAHMKGPLNVTHMIDWNLIPVFRFGFNLG